MLRSLVRARGAGLPAAASAATAAASSPATAPPCTAAALRQPRGLPLPASAPAPGPGGSCSHSPAHSRALVTTSAACSGGVGSTAGAASSSSSSSNGGCGGAGGFSGPGPLRLQHGTRRWRSAAPAPVPAPGPPRSTGGNGQVGPPPPRKPHAKPPPKGPGADKAAGGVAVAPPPSSVVEEGDEFDELDELDEEAGQQLAPYMDSVVKVYCMHTEPNFSLPWQRKRQYSSSSSGFVLQFGGRRWLLTNAHSVDYHTQVKVKRRGDDVKYLARVLSVGVDCDIAALEVDDPRFWEAAPGAPTLELGPLPRLQDGVAVVGYPVGGDTISVTAGVVSRIEVTDYSHGSTDLLAIQIDAAINSGNSGGPVFNRACQCVGIAFQALVGSDVENVGYVIPAPVVAHFLTDYLRTASFSGFPALGLQWQRCESEALRAALGMAAGQKGVLVRAVNPSSAAAGVLRPDDVLLAFDGTPISNDGTVPFRTGERIAFSHLVTSKYVGDTAALQVLRGGQLLELNVTLSKPVSLVPPHLSNRDPPFLVVGGLVFTVASEPYLQSEYGAEYGSDAPVRLLDRLYHGFPATPDEEVVVLSQVLACEATLGYEDVYNVQLLRFNGQRVANLVQLAGLVAAAVEGARGAGAGAGEAGQGSGDGASTGGGSGGFLRFDLEYNEVVVLDAKEAEVATQEVMRSHSIPSPMSAGVREALERAKAGGAAAAAEPQAQAQAQGGRA